MRNSICPGAVILAPVLVARRLAQDSRNLFGADPALAQQHGLIALEPQNGSIPRQRGRGHHPAPQRSTRQAGHEHAPPWWGLIRPEGLADGAATGPPNSDKKARGPTDARAPERQPWGIPPVTALARPVTSRRKGATSVSDAGPEGLSKTTGGFGRFCHR